MRSASIFCVLGLVGPWNAVGAQQETNDWRKKSCCPNVWYTSEACPCSPNEGKCGNCTACQICKGGEACPCIAGLKEGTGILLGVVSHKSVQKFPTVVYVEEIPGVQYVPPDKDLHIDQKNKEFLPRVVPMLVGSTVEFLNSDAFEHNINSPDQEKFNLGNWGQNDRRTYTFKRPGVYTLLCSLHPEMVGYALVLNTPFFALADEKGNFRIPNAPPGRWKLKVWNERLKPKQVDATFEAIIEVGKEARTEIKP